MKTTKLLLLFFAFLCLAATNGNAETLVLYTFTDSVATPETTQPFVAATLVTLSAGSVTFGSAQSTTWIGSGVPYAQGSGGWTAANQSSAKHFLFTLSELNGATFTPTNISLRLRSTSAGPSAMGIRINGTPIHSQNIPADSTFAVSVPVSGFDDIIQAVIRIDGFQDPGRSTTGSGDLRIDDVLVEGTVDEPVGEFPPSVSAPVSPSRTATSLELGGTITATGGPEVTERGIYYSTISGFTPPGQGTKVSETGTFDVGSFAVEVTGLNPDTEYFFRAFATNAEGTGFSDEASRRTLKTPPLDSLVYFTFTDELLNPEFAAPLLTASALGVSEGNIAFASANSASWLALGAEMPYVQSAGGWIADSQEIAKHFEFDLQAQAGKVFTITNISLIHRRTPTGPQDTGIEINGFSVHAAPLTNDVTELLSVPIEGFANITSAVIRIAGWNASATGSYQVDNVLVQGFTGGDIPPTVTTPTVTDIDGPTAVLGGTIADTGDSTVTERGIYWSTIQDFDPGTQGTLFSELGEFSTGAFTLLVEALAPDSTIYFRAFARNFAGPAFSDEASFQSDNNRLAPLGAVWVNELNYNQTFFELSNTNEFIEIVGPIGLDMTGWMVDLHNAAGLFYARYTFPDNFFFEDEAAGFGFYVIGDIGVPNLDQPFTHTAQDSALTKAGTIRIIDANLNEIYAVSYGSPAPTNFPNAVYAGHDDDTVFEDQSLGLSGIGSNGFDHQWGVQTVITPGTVNPAQSLEEGNGGEPPDIVILALTRDDSIVLQAEGVGTWNAVPQYTTNLVTAIWSDISPFTNQQAGGTNTFTFSEPTPNQPVIYRVRATE